MQKRQAPLKQLRQRSPEVFASKLRKSGLLGGSDGKDSTCNEGDVSSIPESGRSPGEGNGYPLQYS